MATISTSLLVFCVICCVELCISNEVSRVKRDDKVIITTIEEAPYVIVKQRGSGNDRFDGIIPEMMVEISKEISLDYELRLVPDNTYGSKDSSGKWNGMIGDIIRGEADMAAAPMTISTQREEVVDFSKSFEDFGTVLLMLKPESGSVKVNSIDELSEQEEISYGIVRDGVTQNFFKTSEVDAYKKVWENLSKNKGNIVNTVEEGVQKVRSSGGKFAFIIESATAEYWVDKAPCDLQIVGKPINDNSFAFAMKKGIDEEMKDNMDRVITDMKTSGKLSLLRRKWKKGDCNYHKEETSGVAPSIARSSSGIIRQVALLASFAVLSILL